MAGPNTQKMRTRRSAAIATTPSSHDRVPLTSNDASTEVPSTPVPLSSSVVPSLPVPLCTPGVLSTSDPLCTSGVLSTTNPPSSSSLPSTPVQLSTQAVSSSSVPNSSVPSASSKTRGYSLSVALSRPQQPGAPSKRPVDIPDGMNRPVCENSALINTEIGVLVRHHIPPRYETWKLVPQEFKEQVIARVMSEFEIDPHRPSHSIYLHEQMRDSAKEFRAELYHDFKINVAKFGLEAAKGMKLSRVHNEEDWEILVNRWESQKWKDKSERNAKAREKLPYGHKAGSKSFSKIFVEMRKREQDADRIQLFQKMHSRGPDPDDWVNNVAKQQYEEMINLQNASRLENTDETPARMDVDIMVEVLGHRPGYAKGCGKGVKPLSRSRASLSNMSTELHETRERLRSCLDELAVT